MITWSDFPKGVLADARAKSDLSDTNTRSSRDPRPPSFGMCVSKLMHWCSPSCSKTGSRVRPALLYWSEGSHDGDVALKSNTIVTCELFRPISSIDCSKLLAKSSMSV